MTFRIVDQKGYCPENTPISSALALDSCSSTGFDLEALCASLQANQCQVAVSTDPGRYLCNYVYFSSLSVVQHPQSLFVHVPPANVLPVEEQVEIIKKLILLLINTSA